MNRYDGTVKWFRAEIGYGFVCADDDPETEYFVHFSSIVMDGYKTLTNGQAVTFALKNTEKGIQAFDVTPV